MPAVTGMDLQEADDLGCIALLGLDTQEVPEADEEQ